MAVFVPGYALALRIGDDFTYATMLLPTVLLIGLGFGLAFPTLNMAATSGVADHEQGLASALLNTSFQLGGAVVLAIVTAVVAAGGAGATGASFDVYRPGLAVVAGVAVVGLAVALAAFGGPPTRLAEVDELPLAEAVEAEAA
jgi:hypothetical protein